MRFREHRDQARATSRRLVVLFVLAVALTVVGVNAALALAWWLITGGGLLGLPHRFIETNTVLVLGFVLGGSWLETWRLSQGPAPLMRQIGAREIEVPRDAPQQRLRNIVDELAIASRLPRPRLYVLDREDAINALAAGWTPQDSAIAVTHGALQRLTRDELQGVIAHEFGHIEAGDTRLNMRLVGMVFGLQVVYMLGQRLYHLRDAMGRHTVAWVPGLALMGAGYIGWMAGRLLKAAVARQREHLADAHAVQFTRLAAGISGALRKIAWQQQQGLHVSAPNTEMVSALLLQSDILAQGGPLATHPPLAERLRRIYGRPMSALPAPVLDEPADAPRELPSLELG